MKNVYYELEESPYWLEYKELKLYFSSDFNRERFKEKVKEYLKVENLKLNTRYKFKVDMSLPLILSLYQRIEKRGFLVYRISDNLKLLNDIKFVSIIM